MPLNLLLLSGPPPLCHVTFPNMLKQSKGSITFLQKCQLTQSHHYMLVNGCKLYSFCVSSKPVTRSLVVLMLARHN